MENKIRSDAMSRSRFPDGFRIMQGRQEYVTYIDHSSLRVWYSETPWHYASHCHSAVEIIVPIRGEVIYRLPEATHHVRVGEVLIVPPNWTHELVMHEGSARYLLLFEPGGIFSMRDMQLVEAVLKTPIYLTEQPELQMSVRALLLQTVDCYEKRQPLWNSMCYSYLLQLYVQLGQHYLKEHTAVEEPVRRMDSEIIESARLYIDQNYMSDISLDDVGSFSGFSKYYFSRIFKQYLGVSFSEYLRNKRIDVAEDLLIHTRRSIQDIAAASGFGSIATFNRVFKDARSCTPSRYREIYGDFL